MSDGGGSGITTLAVLQSLAQARDRWGREATGAIWDAAIVKVILGGSANADDLAAISRLVGDREVRERRRARRQQHLRIGATPADPGAFDNSPAAGRPRPAAIALGAPNPVAADAVDGPGRGRPAHSGAAGLRERGGDWSGCVTLGQDSPGPGIASCAASLTAAGWPVPPGWTCAAAGTTNGPLSTNSPPTCVICGAAWTLESGDLHHRSYRRLGHERFPDLYPTCRGCHDRLHAIYEANPGWRRLDRAQATDLIIGLLPNAQTGR